VSRLPPPSPGAARDLGPQPALQEDQRACGLAGDLLPDWAEMLLAALGREAARHRSLRHALEACVGCGACAQACSFYLGTGDPQNIPAARAELVRRVYRRHLAPGRRPRPQRLDRDLPYQWFAYFHQCSLCRRCAEFCPLGIDTSEVTRAAREALAAAGLAGRAAAQAAAAVYRTGNHQAVTPASWIVRQQTLELELKRETGRDILCPVDEPGAEVLLVPPARDLLQRREVYKGYAKLFHAAGVSWTTSTYLSDALNPGGYLNHRNLRLILHRALEAVRELKPGAVVWGESGHGWRAAGLWSGALGVDWQAEDCLEVKAPMHILEWAHHQHRRGAFQGKLSKEANAEGVVTYHDPCHLARSAGLVAEPRALLAACAPRFAEMPAGASGRYTLCCGSGGGLHGPDQEEAARAGLLPLARVLAGMQGQGRADRVATACDGCRAALGAGLEHYGLKLGVAGVVELLGRALYPPRGGPS
jgi:Fe-S oxidoreductase